MDKYGQYVYGFVSALVDYFGVEEVAKWKFEIFNEPDLDGGNYRQSPAASGVWFAAFGRCVDMKTIRRSIGLH